MVSRERHASKQTTAVLAVLSSDQTWRHGYQLSLETGLASGTIYPLLIRLEDRGYLESKWSEPSQSRPPRHLYRLTAEGRKYAARALAPAPIRLAPKSRPENA